VPLLYIFFCLRHTCVAGNLFDPERWRDALDGVSAVVGLTVK
jgi:hypothetical protein